MKKNVGGMDRNLRIAVGVLLIIGAIVYPPLNPWGFIGVVPLVTALVNWCPLYTLLGINTGKAAE